MNQLDDLLDDKSKWEQLILKTEAIRKDVLALMLACRQRIGDAGYEEVLTDASKTLSQIDTILPGYKEKLEKIDLLIEQVQEQQTSNGL